MNDLFAEDTTPSRIPMDGADVTFHPNPDLGTSPRCLLRTLRTETPWEQRSVRIRGREIPQPRLVSWHGDADYAYSGLKLRANPWCQTRKLVRLKVA